MNRVDEDPLNNQFPSVATAPDANGIIHWLGHLKVGQKITLGYALVLSAAMLGTAIGFMSADHYQQEAREKEEDEIEEL